MSRLDMKKIIFVFMVVCAQLANAQKKVDLHQEDQNIINLLNLNLNTDALSDSVATYGFYIKVTPQKNRPNDIYVSSPLGSKVFGNIDSLLNGIDFNKFLRDTKQKHVIIPVGILVAFHQKMNPNSKIDVWELTKAIPKILATEDQTRYNAVFLGPFFALVDKKVYN